MRDHLPVRGSIRNKLIAELAVKDFNRIRPHLERITLPQHERLLRPGAPTEYAYFPESGMVSLILSLEEGHVGRSRAGRKRGDCRGACWIGR